MFIALSKIVNGSNPTKCISFSNQKCMIQPTVINIHPKFSQEFHYYPFAITLDRCVEVVVLLITYLINYAFQIKQKIWI